MMFSILSSICYFCFQSMNKQRIQLVLIICIVFWVLFSVMIFQMIIFSRNFSNYHSIIIGTNDQLSYPEHLAKLSDNKQTYQKVKKLNTQVEKSKITHRHQPHQYLNQLDSEDQVMTTIVNRIGVLMIACNRTNYLQKSLQQLIDIRADTIDRFKERYGSGNESMLSKRMRAMLSLPLMISFDCNYQSSLTVAREMARASKGAVTNIFLHPEAMFPVIGLSQEQRKLEGYYRIARHYRWAINEAFRSAPVKLDQLIIVEDDLTYSPDFLEYFLALGPLLTTDRSLLCVSAWNDNGKVGRIEADDDDGPGKWTLHRTDFFPGLGWLLSRKLWEEELKGNWPPAFWDDWLRNYRRMGNRTCIRPEISRTATIGEKGVSLGQFFQTHLAQIYHSNSYAPFFDARRRLWHQLSAESYERTFREKVYGANTKEIEPHRMKYLPPAEEVVGFSEKEVGSNTKTFRITYYTRREFEKIAEMFGLMKDFKMGVPRTAYMGVVSFVHNGYRVYLAPPPTRKDYIREWN